MHRLTLRKAKEYSMRKTGTRKIKRPQQVVAGIHINCPKCPRIKHKVFLRPGMKKLRSLTLLGVFILHLRKCVESSTIKEEPVKEICLLLLCL